MRRIELMPQTVLPENGILKRADIAFNHACLDIKAAAEQEAKDVIERAHAVAQDIYVNAEKRGYDAGFSFFFDKTQEINTFRRDFTRDLETLLRETLLYILGSTPKEELFFSVLSQVSQPLKQLGGFTCVVHESNADAMNYAVKAFEKRIDSAAKIVVEVDNNLTENSCLVYLDNEVKDVSAEVMVDRVLFILRGTIEEFSEVYNS